jgi:hypothetical protein
MTRKFRRAKPQDRYIEEIDVELFEKLPDVLTVRDLIEIGLFSGTYQAATYRDNKQGPVYQTIGPNGFFYMKVDVRNFINKLRNKPLDCEGNDK